MRETSRHVEPVTFLRHHSRYARDTTNTQTAEHVSPVNRNRGIGVFRSLSCSVRRQTRLGPRHPRPPIASAPHSRHRCPGSGAADLPRRFHTGNRCEGRGVPSGPGLRRERGKGGGGGGEGRAAPPARPLRRPVRARGRPRAPSCCARVPPLPPPPPNGPSRGGGRGTPHRRCLPAPRRPPAPGSSRPFLPRPRCVTSDGSRRGPPGARTPPLPGDEALP